MLCQECEKRPATVHMTKIVNNKKTEAHLCEECARRRNQFHIFTPFSINDLLVSIMDTGKGNISVKSQGGSSCSTCGYKYYDFKKTGRLGCQDCYKSFAGQLAPVLRRIQNGVRHTGKVPRRSGSRMLLDRQIKELKASLQRAIEEEAFEEAARIRDRIRELERQGGQA